MTRHDHRISLRHVLDHAREAISLARGQSRSDLDTDRLLALGLVQLAQIVGEAARRVSGATREQHPEIPWADIVAFRNRLIHAYDTIDLDVLWQVVNSDMPDLVSKLDRIAPGEQP